MAERNDRRPREKAARGWWATAVGVILLLGGLAVLFFSIWTANPGSIPLNTTTYAGVGMAAGGVAIAAIGLDRGAPKG